MCRNYMNAKELIDILEKLPKDYPILISQDDEGNGYRYLYKNWVSKATFDKEDMNVGIFELSANLIDEGYGDEDVYEEKCIVLG